MSKFILHFHNVFQEALLCVVIALSIPLQAQMTGAPIPFSADWAYYIESERQDSGRFYATQETVRIEKGAGKAEGFISYTTIWAYRKMVAHVLEDWHQKYFSSIIQPRSAGDDFGDFGVPCPFWLGDFTATPQRGLSLNVYLSCPPTIHDCRK